MLFDTHIHTDFSTDSRMLIADAISAAHKAGIGVIVTEHMDLAYPGEPEAFVFDVNKYFAEYGPLRGRDLLLGIEMGMRVDCLEDNRRIAGQHSFDYIIGSIHVVDDIDIYRPDFYINRPKFEVFGRYFTAMKECLKAYDFIHALGHIDYISRYARYDDNEVHYREFSDIMDEILRLVIDKGIALEINTRRLDTRARIEDLLPIYQRYAELGGIMVTIGSDAHRADEVGRRLSVGMGMAEFCGLRPVYFKEGRPEKMKMPVRD